MFQILYGSKAVNKQSSKSYFYLFWQQIAMTSVLSAHAFYVMEVIKKDIAWSVPRFLEKFYSQGIGAF